MDDYEFDISWDWKEKRHKVFLDLGESCVTLSREQILELLAALDEAELSQ